MMRNEFLTERDRRVFQQAGYGKPLTPGRRPAFLLIDFTYEFVGPEREPVLEAVKKIRTVCGLEAWDAVDSVRRILPAAWEAGVPVLYTRGDKSLVGPFSRKNRRSDEASPAEWGEIVREIYPRPQDEVFAKVAPSAFFGTGLIYSLVSKNIDSLIVAGGVISGCVRATVTDAFSYGFKTFVVKEGVFDRGQASGAMSLFDMQAKYADVVSEKEAVELLRSLSGQ